MKNKKARDILICFFFFALACLLGPYSLNCISIAVLVMMVSGILQVPGFAFLSGLLYLIAGIWLPVLPDWNHGWASGFGVLFGNSGGMILALPLISLTIALFRRAVRKNDQMGILLGLLASFVLYFGFALLWFVIKGGSISLSSMLPAFTLYGMDALIAFAIKELYHRRTRKKS